MDSRILFYNTYRIYEITIIKYIRRYLHQITLLILIHLDLLAIFQDTSLVAELLKGLAELLWRRLGRIIGHGDLLVGHTCLDLLDTLLKAEITLDFVLTILAVHLRRCREDYRLVVLSKGHH